MTADHAPSLTELFRAVASAVPEREAVVHGPVRRTYAQTADRVDRLARFLLAAGVGGTNNADVAEPMESGQDHIALYLHNGPEFVESTFAALATRSAPFTVNYRYTARELAQIFRDARPAAVIFHAAFAEVVSAVLPMLDVAPVLIQVPDGSGRSLVPDAVAYETALRTTGSGPMPVTSPDDHMIVYTGGTTGRPKGVLWKQHDLWVAAAGGADFPAAVTAVEVAESAAPTPGPKLLGSAPFMHGAGWWYMLRVLVRGGTIVVPENVARFDPAQVCSLIERERLDTVLLVAEAFARPLTEEVDNASYDLTSVNLLAIGGGVTTPVTKRRLLAAMPNAVLIDSAGSSETGGILRSVVDGANPGESAIFALTPRACVIDDDLRQVLGPGDTGEGWLAAREPLPVGYLRDPEKTARTFVTVDGQRLSIVGDRVRAHADGSVTLLGRGSTVINSGGEKIFVEEVERALLTHPAVADVLVVGRSSSRWGQEVAAVVQLRHAVTDTDLRTTAAEQIARYKLPKTIVSVDTIRRSPAGKPDYGWALTVVTSNAGECS